MPQLSQRRVWVGWILALFLTSVTVFAHADILPPRYATLKIPSKVGKVTEYYSGTKPYTIFYIQDAHANYKAQKNISKIVEIFAKKRRITLVSVEGGVGDVSLSEYRIGSKKKRIKIAEQFLKEGRFSGEEYLNFVEDYPLLLWGIESQVLYDENLIAFQKAEPLMVGMLETMENLRDIMKQIKQRLYPKAYRDLEKKLERAAARDLLHEEASLLFDRANALGMSLAKYPNLERVVDLMKFEVEGDFERLDYERDQLARKLQRIAPAEKVRELLEVSLTEEHDMLEHAAYYEELLKMAEEYGLKTSSFKTLKHAVSYFRSQSKVDATELFKEKEALQDAIAVRMLSFREAETLYAMTKRLHIIEALIRLELVPDQYEVYFNHQDAFRIEAWLPFLRDYHSPLPSAAEINQFDNNLQEFQSFYQVANMRDQALVENLTKKVRAENARESILIAGGFHKDRLVRKMLRTGFHVVVISPNVDLKKQSERYHNLLNEKWDRGRWQISEEK